MPRCNPARREAIAKGLGKYWVAEPCKRRHIGWYSIKGGCIQCRKERPRKYLGDTVESKQAYQKAERERYYKKDPARAIEHVKKYKRENPGVAAGHERKRQAAQLKRVPAWVNLEAVGLFYKNCPEGMTVDHIIPLQGKMVSGLHVENNLQYLTRSENAEKNNKFDPEIWEEK